MTTDPAWRKLCFTACDDQIAEIEILLEGAGAAAVTIEASDTTSIFDTVAPILWPRCRVEALINAAVDPQKILQQLNDAGYTTGGFLIESVADQAWQFTWRDQFKPLCFADRLWVVPSWCAPPSGAELVITLDPGMAFGTGAHPTTRLCLEWLAREPKIAGKRVLDYGCGAGILAIAAAKLGARVITAIDIDIDACRVAHENIARNDCDEITIATPDALHQETFDLIVANLLLRPVLDLQPEFSVRLARHGRIGLSGLLRDQVPDVLDAYAGAFMMDLPQFNEDWALITGTRR